jgi:outer membrane protein assembly factor BamB
MIRKIVGFCSLLSLSLFLASFVSPVGGDLLYQNGDSSPLWRCQKQSSLIIPRSGYVALQAEVMDAVPLSQAVLSTNETGIWRNQTEYTYLWRQDLVSGFDNFGTATYEDGVLYAPSKGNHVADGHVFAVNASDGGKIWSFSARMVDGSPSIDDYAIYFGEGFSVVRGESVYFPKAFALNKTTGEEIWEYTEPKGCGWTGSPIVNGDFVYFTTGFYDYSTRFSMGSGVYALNRTNGQKMWQADIGFLVCSAAYHEGKVFVSGGDRDFPEGQYALNSTNGEIIWHVNYGASWDSSPVVYNGMVIQVVRGLDSGLYTTCVLNETNGQLIRKFEGKGSQSTPLVHDNKIFIPDDDWRIWTFDLETGEEYWHTVALHDGTTESNSYCSPASAGDAIFYQSLNGTFYIINETDSDILWSRPLGGLGLGSPSIGDGRVFITNDYALYAFEIGQGSGDWPMFRQNPVHTGHSENGIEYVKWPLTEPHSLGNVSGAWVTVKFFWRSSAISSAAIAWKVYFFNSAGNTNATDIMIFFVANPSDVNFDGVVNSHDAILLIEAFNTSTTNPNSSPNADINSDKIVDIYDAIILANHWGQNYP